MGAVVEVVFAVIFLARGAIFAGEKEVGKASLLGQWRRFPAQPFDDLEPTVGLLGA